MLTAAVSPAGHVQPIAVSRRPSAADTMQLVQRSVFDLRDKLLPDAVSRIDEFDFLTDMERRLVGHIQARTYVNLFAALARLVDETLDENLGDYCPVDQIDAKSDADDAALARQMLFRRMDQALVRSMPAGYRAMSDLDELAGEKSSWGVRALSLAVELFKQIHHDAAAASGKTVSPIFRNAFLREQSGVSLRAMIAEINIIQHNADLSLDARDAAVDGFIELIEKFDRTLQAQAALDTRYFAMYCARPLDKVTLNAIETNS